MNETTNSDSPAKTPPSNSLLDALPGPMLIFTYTRAQALADGEQIEVTATAREAGIRLPVFLTRAVWENYVAVPPGVTGQDEAGRLWDVLWLARFAFSTAEADTDRVTVNLHVRNDNRSASPVELLAVCGPCDIYDPAPSITIMLPHEN